MSEETPNAFEQKLLSLPPVISWMILLISLILLPYNANIFSYLSDPQHSYAEFALRLPKKTIVIAKNSGSMKVSLLDSLYDLQVCQSLTAQEAFELKTNGMIPPASYAVVMVPRAAVVERHVMLNDVEVKTNQLRLTTPIEETQYYFAAVIVFGVAIMLTILLARWYFEDATSRADK